MEASVAVEVLDKSVALLVVLSANFGVVLGRHSKIILIHKVVACVVWGVNVYHLDLAKIGLAEQFENIKVITLDIEVLRIIKINRLFLIGTERCRDARVCQYLCLGLVRPCHLISLLLLGDKVGRKLLLEYIKVNRKLYLAILAHYLGHCRRKECLNLTYILLGYIH